MKCAKNPFAQCAPAREGTRVEQSWATGSSDQRKRGAVELLLAGYRVLTIGLIRIIRSKMVVKLT